MSGLSDWNAAGRPWTPARPIAALTRTLRGHGYTVYILGNEDHATANPPEDHMPFSATGWPVASPRWYVHALDIMPGDGLPTLADLGAQLSRDKITGYPGAYPIKYMNWTPAGGSCTHESWEPGHNVYGSSDAGHIHLSIRSDCTQHTAMDSYDPVARLRGGGGQPTPPPRPSAPPYPLAYPPNVFGDISGPDWCHGGFYGSEVPAVRAIQQQLIRKGFVAGIADPNSGWADGKFEQPTVDATRRFQQAHGLEVDGLVGPQTWHALFS